MAHRASPSAGLLMLILCLSACDADGTGPGRLPPSDLACGGSGTLHSDFSTGGQWLARDNPHVVVDTLHVTGTLSIEPGVRICVEPDVPILIEEDGAIEAVGTEAAPIVLTAGDSAKPWGGILTPRVCYADVWGAVGERCDVGSSVFEHVRIEHADVGILGGSRVRIEHAHFRQIRCTAASTAHLVSSRVDSAGRWEGTVFPEGLDGCPAVLMGYGASSGHTDVFADNTIVGSGGVGLSLQAFGMSSVQQAPGSVILDGGRIVGSGGVGLEFSLPRYWIHVNVAHSRPIRITGGASIPVRGPLELLNVWPTAADRDSLRGNAGDTIAVWSDESEGFVVTPGVVVKLMERPIDRSRPFVVSSEKGIRIEPGGELAGFVRLHGPLHAAGTADAPVRITGGVLLACGYYTNTPCDYGSHIIHGELDGAWLESISQNITLEHVVLRRSHPIRLPDGARATDVVIENALDDGLLLGDASVATDIRIMNTEGAGLLLGSGSTATNITVEGARGHGVVLGSGSTATNLSIMSSGSLLLGDRAVATEVTVERGWGHGVVLGSNAELTQCAVRGNGGSGILVDSSSTGAVIHDCALESNRLLGVEYEGTGTVDARFNWWGDPAGPFGTSGDGIEGNVDYSSYLTEPPE